MSGNLFDLNSYLIRRKVFKIFGASFHVYDGEQVVGFCKQKAFKLKEDIRLFTDETAETELLVIQARQIIDFAAAYDIVDPKDGIKIGAARRKGLKSILRDSWELLDANDQPIATLQEDSASMAMVRRLLSNLIPQKFRINVGDEAPVILKQRFNPFIYKLDVGIPPQCSLDKRLIAGLATLIAAIEGRQE